jgi:hypothetical protein
LEQERKKEDRIKSHACESNKTERREVDDDDERCWEIGKQDGSHVHSQFTTPLLRSQPQCLSFSPSTSNTGHHFSTAKGESFGRALATKGDVGGTVARSKSIFVCKYI